MEQRLRRIKGRRLVGRLAGWLALVCLPAFPASGKAPASGTPVRVEVDAASVASGSRVLLDVQPHLRVLGVRPAKSNAGEKQSGKSLVTLFDGPSRESVDLQFVRSEALSSRGTQVAFPFDVAKLLKKPGLHLGFVKLVGRWEVSVPGAEPGEWTVLAGQKLDYEVPVLQDHLDKPEVCLTLESEHGAYRAVVSDSCGPSRTSGAASE